MDFNSVRSLKVKMGMAFKYLIVMDFILPKDYFLKIKVQEINGDNNCVTIKEEPSKIYIA